MESIGIIQNSIPRFSPLHFPPKHLFFHHSRHSPQTNRQLIQHKPRNLLLVCGVCACVLCTLSNLCVLIRSLTHLLVLDCVHQQIKDSTQSFIHSLIPLIPPPPTCISFFLGAYLVLASPFQHLHMHLQACHTKWPTIPKLGFTQFHNGFSGGVRRSMPNFIHGNNRGFCVCLGIQKEVNTRWSGQIDLMILSRLVPIPLHVSVGGVLVCVLEWFPNDSIVLHAWQRFSRPDLSVEEELEDANSIKK